jgi:hypothetical protein
VSKLSVYFPVTIPKCHPTGETDGGRTVYMLDERFKFFVGSHYHVIPAGYKFDGASVPRGLWNTFPPFDPLHIAPALIHDWLYGAEYYPQKIADDVFDGALRYNQVKWWRRSAMVFAVRAFGGKSYRSHTIASIMQIRALSGIFEQRRPLYNDVRDILPII